MDSFPAFFKNFSLFSKLIQASAEESEDQPKEHEKIITDDCASYGTLGNDQEIATKKDVSRYICSTDYRSKIKW